MLFKIAAGLVAILALTTTANAQSANSRRIPASIESLGGVSPLSPQEIAWANQYPVKVRPILANWVRYNGACRGGPGPRVTEQNLEEWMTRVCAARNGAAGMMRLHGYCYGREGELGVENEWHACTGISHGNNYFEQ